MIRALFPADYFQRVGTCTHTHRSRQVSKSSYSLAWIREGCDRARDRLPGWLHLCDLGGVARAAQCGLALLRPTSRRCHRRSSCARIYATTTTAVSARLSGNDLAGRRGLLFPGKNRSSEARSKRNWSQGLASRARCRLPLILIN